VTRQGNKQENRKSKAESQQKAKLIACKNASKTTHTQS
jgi:hypothetical protein